MLRRIDVEKNLGDIPSITCSPSQVNQVVLNLVTNAAQAMEKPRGRITATTRREGDKAIAIETEDDGKGNGSTRGRRGRRGVSGVVSAARQRGRVA